MNARLRARLYRQPAPAIVPFLWDAFDRCDPTRSHEAKPSQRARNAHQIKRSMRYLALALAGVSGLILIVTSYH